ncbi:MAG TPA: alkaline phosphatase family protein [Pseudolysinimonas sp.]|nr:alkaline phosphatase family protein [Pseudolysinimonas sp.]
MLPAAKTHRFSLADVLPNCLAALSGTRGGLGLAPVSHALVVVVDGLGMSALQARRGHARTLASRLDADKPIGTVFPSTTAAALTSFATGVWPGRHGVVGYSAPGPDGDVVNHLNGWDDGTLPTQWQRMPTLFERATAAGHAAIAIGPARYRDSGFTRAVLRGAEYRAGASIADRVERAQEAMVTTASALVYLYVPELDTVSHARGGQSPEWTAALEELDAAIAPLTTGLGPRHGMLVTADHGIVDVPHDDQVIVDPALLDGVRAVAGEPRCLQLHLEPGIDADVVAEAWRAVESRRGWVATRAEAIEAGWFGPVDAEVAPRIGDVLIAARERVAYYVDPDDRGRRMIGQHGSLTAEELTIPLLRFGRWRTGA